MRYAHVAVNAPVYRTFCYHIPDALLGHVQVGHLVRVAFGTAMQPGIVVALHAETDLPETKPIQELLDAQPVMTPEHIQLGLWMSERYLAAPGAALWLMLPPGLTGQSVQYITLLQADAQATQATQQAIIDALRTDGTRTNKQLERAFGPKAARNALNALAAAGVIQREAHLAPPGAKPKTVGTVRRTFDTAALETIIADLGRAHKQIRILRYLAQWDEIDTAQLRDATNANTSDLKNLSEKGLLLQSERLSYRDSLADRDFVPSSPPALTAAQSAVWQVLAAALNPTPRGLFAAYLLHGVTGSGKTEIYLRAIAETLAQGRQAIFLVPEIALTPQTIRRVAQRFPEQVAVVHGSLSTGERYDTWQRARSGAVQIIVGTRSALFTPLPNIGLIVIDEEHDHSYKHEPPFNPPYYHARTVAEQMMRLNNGVLLLGSATPDMETYFRTQRGDLTYLHLPSRIMAHKQRVQAQVARFGIASHYQEAGDEALSTGLPPVEIIDMRDELKADNRSMFSRALQTALRDVLARNEQAILFLNRRGQATYVFCRDCGFVFTCPRCDTPMTYHRAGEDLRCHHCGHHEAGPQACPACNSQRIKYFGAGTQQVEAALHDLLPDVRTVRWDADTANRPEMHETILQRFIDHEADVIVGTQMVAKGLDLPLVTLVGVVSADPGLFLPDFRASERAFQLLTQVAGRAGRSVLGGRVIMQTYQPKHESILFAAQHDYAGFYAHELEKRRELGYPPFRRMARVLVQSSNPVQAERDAQQAAANLRHLIDKRNLTDTRLIGPAPCFFRKIDKVYRWQVLIRSNDPLALLRGFSVRKGWYVDLDVLDVL